MITIFAGKHWTWTLRMAAVAAKRFPGLPPTHDGLNQLQDKWLESGEPPLQRGCVGDEDVEWARNAFAVVDRSAMNYD